MIVDTSGSMNENDRPRYAAQIAKILSDLAADDDRLIVIRMPTNSEALEAAPGALTGLLRRLGAGGYQENCSAGAEPRLGVALREADRPKFKSEIDTLLHNGQGTYFAQPIHTARTFLGSNAGTSRLLLFLADSGGFETNCAALLTQELAEIRRGGTYVGLINLGADAGTFHGSPAFDSTAAAPNSEQLVRAVASIYQQFLGSQKTQTGTVRGAVTVQVDPYVKEAYLVVASDGPVSSLTSSPGSPTAEAIDDDYRGGGSTEGLDGTVRGYRILRLKNPGSGSWTFTGPDLRNGGWMLLQDYAVTLRSIGAQQSAPGATAQLQFELVDERTGRRIADPQAVPGAAVQLTVDGKTLAAHNNGDGTFTAEHRCWRESLLVSRMRRCRPSRLTIASVYTN
jgi:hypothetical protein